jgi:WD40 repeat protein
MSELAESLPSKLSRRTLIKGLAGCVLALAEIGCSSESSSSAHGTPTIARTFAPSPTSTSTSTAKRGALGGTLLTYSGHTGEVFAVVWHDARIASGGADGSVQVWNLNTGHTFATYTGHSGQVTALSWSPDGIRTFNRTDCRISHRAPKSAGESLQDVILW